MPEPQDVASDLALRRRMAELLQGYQVSAALGAVTRLGVVDALADGPLTPEELACRVGADPSALRRVVRALAGAALFETVDGDRLALTPLGSLLRADAPGSARGAALAATEEWRWCAYGHVAHSLRTGEPGFEAAHGCGLWQYLDAHPEAATWFNAVMSRVSSVHAAALARTDAFAGVATLVDVGGGHGELVVAVLQAHPDVRAILLELPSVAAGARERLASSPVAGRCEVVAGDFFQDVPGGGDVYVLSWVLHDWDDAAAVRVLSRCRAAMPVHGRLLVVEMVLPEPGDPDVSPDVERLVREADLDMLVVVGGRERTRAEYEQLFAGADLRLSRVVPLDGLPWSLLEAVVRA